MSAAWTLGDDDSAAAYPLAVGIVGTQDGLPGQTNDLIRGDPRRGAH